MHVVLYHKNEIGGKSHVLTIWNKPKGENSSQFKLFHLLLWQTTWTNPYYEILVVFLSYSKINCSICYSDEVERKLLPSWMDWMGRRKSSSSLFGDSSLLHKAYVAIWLCPFHWHAGFSVQRQDSHTHTPLLTWSIHPHHGCRDKLTKLRRMEIVIIWTKIGPWPDTTQIML